MMKRAIPILCAAALSVTALGAAVAPAAAAPIHQSQRPVFQADGNYAWYNGHRGYKHHYAGYRYYNGYWFPPAAFVVGALIFGGILNAIIHH